MTASTDSSSDALCAREVSVPVVTSILRQFDIEDAVYGYAVFTGA